MFYLEALHKQTCMSEHAYVTCWVIVSRRVSWAYAFTECTLIIIVMFLLF